MKLSEAQDTSFDTFSSALKKAAIGVKEWHLRVHDLKSAQAVKGVGPLIAKASATGLRRRTAPPLGLPRTAGRDPCLPRPSL